MKKSLYYILTCCIVIISSTLVIITNNTNATINNNNLLSTETEFKPNTKLSSKNETVYIITDHDGSINKSFIGNTLNVSNNPIPLNLNIKYYLDDHEVPANEIAGKSGHVKITYNFTATNKYQNKTIPFLTVTGINLDSTKFSNLKIDHGKIINESDENTTLVGYTMAGLNEDLNTNFLPASFTITADTTDFTFNTIYTFATNDIFADLDTSKLSSIEDLISSVNQLSSALDQIISGSSELTNGLDSAFAGAQKLQAGTNKLNSGAHGLATGATTINNGAHGLAAGATELSNGLNSLVDFNSQILNKINATIEQTKAKITPIMAEVETLLADPNCPPELVAKFTELKSTLNTYYSQASTAVTAYTGNIEKLADGAIRLKNGANQLAAGTDNLATGAAVLANGTTELKTGTDSLVDGLSQLSTGSHKLNSGLAEFKSQGINKLVNFANHDLNSFLDNLRATVAAAKSYRHYSDPAAESVKFIFKTPAL